MLQLLKESVRKTIIYLRDLMEIQLQNTTFYKIFVLHTILTKYISLSVLSDSLKRMLKLIVNYYWKHKYS